MVRPGNPDSGSGGGALDDLCVNTIRVLSADMVQQANSGHPGLPMGAVAMAYALWNRFLKFNPKNPLWPDRDRFVLSAGHGSALLYSLLHLTRYDLPLGELKRFRQSGSRTPGHPERGHHTPGVELSTGPLGQGVRERGRNGDRRGVVGRPSLLLVRTTIGFGSPKKQNTFGAHGTPLGDDELKATKQALSWPTEELFYLPNEAVCHFQQAVMHGGAVDSAWAARLDASAASYPTEAAEWRRVTSGNLPDGWSDDLPRWKPEDKPVATRVAAGAALNALAGLVSNIVGGSADLNPSTSTVLKGGGDFQPPSEAADTSGAVGGGWGRAGWNVHFGVREHAMGAAVNGMAAHGGIIPYGATFLVFSDYVKPSIRLAALMGLPAVYVFTHDSRAVGEDGPTHEPVEQLAGLRAIPGLTVIRPADANEAAEAWAVAVERGRPTVLALSRQNVPVLDRSASRGAGVARGGYVLADGDSGRPDVILIGSGSEVFLCVKARERLAARGVAARVVSLPSWELFREQDAGYRDAVLPPAVRGRVTVEAGASMG